METIVHKSHYGNNKINNFVCVRYHNLIAGSHSLLDNSKLLYDIKTHSIAQGYNNREKYTSDKQILIDFIVMTMEATE